MTQPLGSPAAQAVLDAAQSAYWSMEAMAPNDANVIAAATLRAAADHVVPEQPHEDTFEYCCDYAQARTKDAIRHRLIAIAAELEGAQSTGSTHLEIGDE